MKLPVTQAKLLTQLQNGATLHYCQFPFRGGDPYYWVSEGFQNCTKAAKALLGKGLVERDTLNPRDWAFRLTDAGRAFQA